MEKLNTKEYLKQDFNRIIDLIEQKVSENKNTESDNRITEPFEAVINPTSITKDALQRYSKLSIECMLTHDTAGNLIIATGSQDSGGYDWGEYTDTKKEDFEEYPIDLESTFEAHNEIVKAENNYAERIKNNSNYSLHHHPSKKLIPSPSDLFHSFQSKTKVDFVLTEEGVAIYKPTGEMLEKLFEKYPPIGRGLTTLEEENEYVKFMEDLGILEIVKFEDEQFNKILKYISGKGDL